MARAAAAAGSSRRGGELGRGGSGGAAGRGGGGGRGGTGGGGSTGSLGRWELLAPMPGGARQEFQVVGRQGHGLRGRRVRHRGSDARRVEAYDPTTNTWTTEASVPFSADHPNVAATDGKLYILGEIGARNTAEYDPETNTWTMKRADPDPAGRGRGGRDRNEDLRRGRGHGLERGRFGPTVRDFAVYDTITDTWETLDPIPEPQRNHALGAAVDGIFYIVGGRTNGPIDGLQSRLDAYDPATRSGPRRRRCRWRAAAAWAAS